MKSSAMSAGLPQSQRHDQAALVAQRLCCSSGPAVLCPLNGGSALPWLALAAAALTGQPVLESTAE